VVEVPLALRLAAQLVEELLELLVKLGRELDDVLVVPHHGSRTSSTPPFVAAVAPGVAVFTPGYRNRFGHPRPEVVARYHMAQRYTVEFLPGLVYLACLAVRALPREPAPREAVLRRVTLLSMVALACNLLSQSYWVNVEARV
jgi:hypothetical protein